jgi:hypothetical protein
MQQFNRGDRGSTAATAVELLHIGWAKSRLTCH